MEINESIFNWEYANWAVLEFMPTHPAIADHCPLPRAQFQDVSTKQLLTTNKIHFQCVELFLKGISVHALEQNSKSLFRMLDKLIALLAHILKLRCTAISNRLAQGPFSLYGLSKTKSEWCIGVGNDVCEENKSFATSMMPCIFAITAVFQTWNISARGPSCQKSTCENEINQFVINIPRS